LPEAAEVADTLLSELAEQVAELTVAQSLQLQLQV
jgi:hypothetical protein